MTRRGRLSKLEARRPADRVRVVITRQIVPGGATGPGEEWQDRPRQVVRREFDLYPDGLPGRWPQ